MNNANDMLKRLHVCFFNAWEKSRTTVNHRTLRAKTAIINLTLSFKKHFKLSRVMLDQTFSEKEGVFTAIPVENQVYIYI